MADGNHHANKFAKNTDPDDVSLFAGKAYFPEETAYQQYLQDVQKKPALPEEVTSSHSIKGVTNYFPTL